jgi:phage recombination protein Bet
VNTAIAERPKGELVAPAVTQEQTALIKSTIAKDATDAELQLFFYDCARQGVHPLDRLIHFTKRKGKYTPVTSIDLMRSRAADTGEYAGSDDAAFVGAQKSDTWAATVTVWRLVQGQRCSFTATARWSEYKPDEAFMWHRMPHTMLAKCAEALALRKGFPRQLAGVYSEEEMAQADRLEAPDRPVIAAAVVPDPIDEPPAPEGCVRVMLIEDKPTRNAHVTKYTITLSTGEQVSTINEWLASVAKDALEKRLIMRAETKATNFGTDLVSLKPAEDPTAPVLPLEPLAADDIPF